MKHWYVVHTHARAENQAVENLARQNFEVYLPKFERRRRHARRADFVKSPLFPRYLFVRLDLGLDRWRSIFSTIGVSRLVLQGEKPAAVPDGIVETIKSQEGSNGCVEMHTIRPFVRGERVRVMSGTFCDQVGQFLALDEKSRVVMLLSLLGREITVRLPASSVAALT